MWNIHLLLIRASLFNASHSLLKFFLYSLLVVFPSQYTVQVKSLARTLHLRDIDSF
jgi:hypothetical protein